MTFKKLKFLKILMYFFVLSFLIASFSCVGGDDEYYDEENEETKNDIIYFHQDGILDSSNFDDMISVLIEKYEEMEENGEDCETLILNLKDMFYKMQSELNQRNELIKKLTNLLEFSKNPPNSYPQQNNIEIQKDDFLRKIQHLNFVIDSLRKNCNKIDYLHDDSNIKTGLFYRIQLGAREVNIGGFNFYETNRIMKEDIIREGRFDKIRIGYYNTYNEAKIAEFVIRKSGNRNTWVIAILDGVRIPIRQAIQIEKDYIRGTKNYEDYYY